MKLFLSANRVEYDAVCCSFSCEASLAESDEGDFAQHLCSSSVVFPAVPLVLHHGSDYLLDFPVGDVAGDVDPWGHLCQCGGCSSHLALSNGASSSLLCDTYELLDEFATFHTFWNDIGIYEFDLDTS